MSVFQNEWLRSNLSFIVFIAVLVGLFLVFRTPQSKVESLAELDGTLSRGEPTVIEFYSNA